MDPPCGEPILWGISPDFSGLSPCYRWIAYVLLTRAPVAGKGIATSPLPLDLHVLGLSLAFILSQDQTLRCIFSFSLLYLRSVTWPNWLLSLFFYCTTLASSIPSMNFSLTAAPWPPRFAKVLQRYCLSLLQSKFFSMFFLNYFSMKWKLFLFQIVIAKIFLPLHRTIKVIWNANAISRL